MNGITTGLDHAPNPVTRAGTVRPPRWPVLGAIACLACSAALLAIVTAGHRSDSMLLMSLGYLAGSIVVSLLIVVHRMRKQKAEQSLWYEPRQGLATTARIVLMLGLIVGLGNAFLLATEIAKR